MSKHHSNCIDARKCDCFEPYEFSKKGVQTFRSVEPFISDELMIELQMAQLKRDIFHIECLQEEYEEFREKCLQEPTPGVAEVPGASQEEPESSQEPTPGVAEEPWRFLESGDSSSEEELNSSNRAESPLDSDGELDDLTGTLKDLIIDKEIITNDVLVKEG